MATISFPKVGIVRWSIISILLASSLYGLLNDLKIEITGNIFFSSHYLLSGDTHAKTESDAEEVVAHIIKKYADAGFPFCRVYPKIISTNNSIEKIILRVDEGSRVIISDYRFDIPGKTEAGAVKKVADLKPDSYFSSKEIERAKRNLRKTDVFEDINENIIYSGSKHYLLFSLKEKKSDYVTAFASASENDYNFSISFYSLNLLGTLRKLQFRYEYEKLFSLQFTEPILIFPAALSGNLSLWTYDSVRLVQVNGKFTAPLGRYFNVSLLSGAEAVSYYGDSVPRGHTDNLLGIGFGCDYETSTWACRQDISFEYLFRQHDRQRIQYDGGFEAKKFNIKPHLFWVKSDSFEYFDYYRVGGAKTLRGYLDEEFIITNALWVNIEYKKFFLFPVVDIGWLEDDLVFSYGFGVEAKSNVADASLVIAWPKQGAWRDGKVHVMLERGF